MLRLRLSMKRYVPCLVFLLIASSFFGCNSSRKAKNDDIISQRYIHKYGYDLSKKEWQSADYPGKVVTMLRNGVTRSSSYENGVLHGPTTYTFPHSHTLESLNIYEWGNLVKTLTYDIRGIPQKEHIFLSPAHVKITHWYKGGSPLCTEEYYNSELFEGEYYNERNEVESRINKGSGIRIIRNENEQITTKETIENGYPILRETFHPHGMPHIVIPLSGGKIHGIKKVFSQSGDPISKETYYQDILHGPATYFQNGCRYLEVNYSHGLKHGLERHFIDGHTLLEETEWVEGYKHGPSTFIADGTSTTRFYYNHIPVTKERYRELCEQEENIAIMHERAMNKN